MNEKTKEFVETMRKNAANIQSPGYSGEFGETLDRPSHQPDVERTSPETLKSMIDDTVVIDVQKQGSEKIKGSVVVKSQEYDWLNGQKQDNHYVVVGDQPGEERAEIVAQHMISRNFPFVTVLEGGFSAWKQSGFPAEPRK
ncbi:MAG: rhodanese-like domain-containing protein [Oceanidesulfovibrio sp.]